MRMMCVSKEDDMRTTYPICSQPIPAHIVVMPNGNWLQREHLAQFLTWAEKRLETTTPWERKFLINEIETVRKALAK